MKPEAISIRGNQRQSEAIRPHLRCNQVQSEAIRCNQRQSGRTSGAIRCNQVQSEAIGPHLRCNQLQSEAIRGNQMQSALCFRVFVFWADRKGLCFVFSCFGLAQRACVLCFRVLADPPQNTARGQIHNTIHQDTCILDSSSQYIKIHQDTKSRYMYLGCVM